VQARTFFGSLAASAFDAPAVEGSARDHAGPLRAIDARTASIFVAGAIIIVSFQAFGSVAFFDDHFAARFEDSPAYQVYGYLYWFVSSFLWLFLLPLAVVAISPALSVRDVGLGLGDWRFGARAALCLYLAMVPVLALASFRDNFVDYYPMSDWIRSEIARFGDGQGGSLWPFVVYEAAYALYFVGWEFFHRGFLTVGLSRTFGWYAILVVTIPFALLHVDKPMPEAYGAIVASLVLGWLAIRTRSSWWGFFVHASVAVTMDVFAVLHQV